MRILFNDQIFALQEDLPVQAMVAITYEVSGEEQDMSREATLTIYRRTALSWDDSGKIASFIMPNEGIISQFSHKASPTGEIAGSYRIAEKFFRAVRICDAVGVRLKDLPVSQEVLFRAIRDQK